LKKWRDLWEIKVNAALRSRHHANRRLSIAARVGQVPTGKTGKGPVCQYRNNKNQTISLVDESSCADKIEDVFA
jgi:hypothetical protein